MSLSDRLQSAAVERSRGAGGTAEETEDDVVLDADGVIDLRRVESSPHPSGVTGVPDAIAAIKGRLEAADVEALYLSDDESDRGGWFRRS